MKKLHAVERLSWRCVGAAAALSLWAVASATGVEAMQAEKKAAQEKEEVAVPLLVTPCTLTDRQREEVAVVRGEVASLEAEPRPLDTRIIETRRRINQLSQELVKCLSPEIDRMVAQASESAIPADQAKEIRQAALLLATDLRMSPEERARLTAKLQQGSQWAGTEGESKARELQQQSIAFERKLDGELGNALKILDGEKRKLQRLER